MRITLHAIIIVMARQPLLHPLLRLLCFRIHVYPIQAHCAVILVHVGEESHVQGIHITPVGGGAGID